MKTWQAETAISNLSRRASDVTHKLKSEIIEIGVVSAKQDFHTLDQADVKKAVAKAK